MLVWERIYTVAYAAWRVRNNYRSVIPCVRLRRKSGNPDFWIKFLHIPSITKYTIVVIASHKRSNLLLGI